MNRQICSAETADSGNFADLVDLILQQRALDLFQYGLRLGQIKSKVFFLCINRPAFYSTNLV